VTPHVVDHYRCPHLVTHEPVSSFSDTAHFQGKSAFSAPIWSDHPCYMYLIYSKWSLPHPSSILNLIVISITDDLISFTPRLSPHVSTLKLSKNAAGLSKRDTHGVISCLQVHAQYWYPYRFHLQSYQSGVSENTSEVQLRQSPPSS
jgi:hypothetical protein